MTGFMKQLEDVEKLQKLSEKLKGLDLDNLIILDPRKDPDPHGLHGIPLTKRLKAMGWP